ncbi:diaminopimelate decarboxylase [Betaproteobacteria bacterium]|nr:diaminopimelate decarboxylase [Betaproteobacteria bacterium]GHU44164.1 diaminopimelate decarboxylase [Betaproteobacteria bacterium]
MTLPGSPYFAYRQDCLHVENLPLPGIAAQFGTPCYVYSRAALTENLREFQASLAAHPLGADSLVCYAVKANSNLAILNLFARLGAGFDIVSGGELQRALAAGADARKIVFSGIGKSVAEMQQALNAGILCFNVESAAELERLNAVAGQLGKQAPVSLRVNPDVDPKTHPYISTGLKSAKFGVPIADAPALYERAAHLPNLEVVGVDCHIGSQLLDPAPFSEAVDRLLVLLDELAARGIAIRHLDLGGGLGIRYQQDETPPEVAAYLTPLLDKLQGRGKLKIILEPGRRLVGNAGLLLTRVEYLKPCAIKNFAIIDAAMNDLMRPALYKSWHEIVTVTRKNIPAARYDVVGPVCESGDFFGQGRPLAIAEGDLLAVLSAGAYGMAMSSNYNTRPRAAEVLVDGDKAHLIRRRESIADLYAHEQRIPADSI